MTNKYVHTKIEELILKIQKKSKKFFGLNHLSVISADNSITCENVANWVNISYLDGNGETLNCGLTN